eukprot:m.215178 g.215178  ORF g.215178 m.215178 type:complete len:756 (+) comp10775_c0_seq9:1021-3288(+)
MSADDWDAILPVQSEDDDPSTPPRKRRAMEDRDQAGNISVHEDSDTTFDIIEEQQRQKQHQTKKRRKKTKKQVKPVQSAPAPQARPRAQPKTGLSQAHLGEESDAPSVADDRATRMVALRQLVRTNPNRIPIIERQMQQRNREFFAEHPCFKPSPQGFLCQLCSASVGGKMSTLKSHIKSRKHQECLQSCASHRQLLINSRKIALGARARHQDSTTAPSGARARNVDDNAARVSLLTTILKHGLPLSTASYLADFLRVPADSPRVLASWIPEVRESVESKLKTRLAGKKFSVIFDGTTNVAECLCIVVRFVERGELVQLCAKLKMYDKSFNAASLAFALIHHVQAFADGQDLTAVMMDCASVNYATMKIVNDSSTLPNFLVCPCLSHTMSNTGEHFLTDTLQPFLTNLRAFFRSHKQARRWANLGHRRLPTVSQVRWWSEYEFCAELLNQWDELIDFLTSFQTDEELAKDNKKGSALSTLLTMRMNRETVFMVELELRVLVQAGKPLVETTYMLEGDQPLAFLAFEQVEATLASLDRMVGNAQLYMPSVQQFIARFAGGPDRLDFPTNMNYVKAMNHAKMSVRRAYDYLRKRVESDLEHFMQTLKATRALDPRFAVAHKHDMDLHEVFEALKLDQIQREDLTTQWSHYVYTATGRHVLADRVEQKKVIWGSGVCNWWATIGTTRFPAWQQLFTHVALIQPSSAAAERCFSFLQRNLDLKKQPNQLEDKVEVTTMLAYNNRCEDGVVTRVFPAPFE